MGIHVWFISPIVLRFTRHALLYQSLAWSNARGLQSLPMEPNSSFLVAPRERPVVVRLRDSRSWMSAAILVSPSSSVSTVQLTVRYGRTHAFGRVKSTCRVLDPIAQGTRSILDLIP
jgi:hypothetical protein